MFQLFWCHLFNVQWDHGCKLQKHAGQHADIYEKIKSCGGHGYFQLAIIRSVGKDEGRIIVFSTVIPDIEWQDLKLELWFNSYCSSSHPVQDVFIHAVVVNELLKYMERLLVRLLLLFHKGF